MIEIQSFILILVAEAQLASDLGKGVIQGVSQYISKRMRTVRVHLKSGYRVLLYQEKE